MNKRYKLSYCVEVSLSKFTVKSFELVIAAKDVNNELNSADLYYKIFFNYNYLFSLIYFSPSLVRSFIK